MTLLVRRSNVVLSPTRHQAARAIVRGAHFDAATLLVTAGDARWVNDVITAAKRQGTEVFIDVGTTRAEVLIRNLVTPGVHGIVLRGVDSPSVLQRIERELMVREREVMKQSQRLEVILVLTSSTGVWRLPELLTATSRIRQVGLDERALCRSLGVLPTYGSDPCAFARGRVVVETIARGVQPIARPHRAALLSLETGPDELTLLPRRLKNLGFKGMFDISMESVGVVNSGFSPSPEEVEYCRAVRRVFADAVASGKAAVGLGDKMIDVPVDSWAQSVLELADACTSRDRAKDSA